jgi:hypothetical protein
MNCLVALFLRLLTRLPAFLDGFAYLLGAIDQEELLLLALAKARHVSRFAETYAPARPPVKQAVNQGVCPRGPLCALLPPPCRRRQVRPGAARSVAESSTKQAFANAKVEIERLAAQLDKGQALDLRWKIIGLFVSAGGMWLSYWV